jgi:hypothetical protein
MIYLFGFLGCCYTTAPVSYGVMVFISHPRDVDALANRVLAKYGHKTAQIKTRMEYGWKYDQADVLNKYITVPFFSLIVGIESDE